MDSIQAWKSHAGIAQLSQNRQIPMALGACLQVLMGTPPQEQSTADYTHLRVSLR
jgi:hypothetical protein